MEKQTGDAHIEHVSPPAKAIEEGLPLEPDEEAMAKVGNEGRLDYSGAAKKTNPAEIALVKKLDWYIMPM